MTYGDPHSRPLTPVDEDIKDLEQRRERRQLYRYITWHTLVTILLTTLAVGTGMSSGMVSSGVLVVVLNMLTTLLALGAIVAGVWGFFRAMVYVDKHM